MFLAKTRIQAKKSGAEKITYKEEEKNNRNVAQAHRSDVDSDVNLGVVALELLLDPDSPMSLYRKKKTRLVRSTLGGIINATLTGDMSPRRISVAFLMCTTTGSSSSADPNSMSRMLGRSGWLG